MHLVRILREASVACKNAEIVEYEQFLYLSELTSINALLLVAGHIPQPAEGDLIVGKVGKDLSIEEGYEAAK